MKIIGASYSLTEYEIEPLKGILDTVQFKDMIHKNITYSLANTIMVEVKVPIPEHRMNSYFYEVRIAVCDEKEFRKILRDQRKLEAYKHLFKGSEDMVERYLKEQDIERLTGN